MVKTRKLFKTVLFLMTFVLVLSSISICAFAATSGAKSNGECLYNCKWNTKYYIVTDAGKAYGTNTFTIYGGKTVTINSHCATAIDSQKAFVNSIKFKIQIYNGSKLVNTYTKGLKQTFKVPGWVANKYTVKVTPIIDKAKFNQAGVYYMAEYFKYSLSK